MVVCVGRAKSGKVKQSDVELEKVIVRERESVCVFCYCEFKNKIVVMSIQVID